MTKRNVGIIVVALVVVIALIAFSNMGKISYPTTTQPNQTAVQAVPQVVISSAGFLPEAIKIKKGEQVKWVNQDKVAHQVAADPYPTHASLPSFFSLALLSNDSYTYTFNQAGTYTYQDYLNPLKFKGTVIVE
jgi:plastocyanin